MALKKPTPAKTTTETPSTETDHKFVGSVSISALGGKNHGWYICWVNGRNLIKTQSLGDVLNFAEDILTSHREPTKGRLQ